MANDSTVIDIVIACLLFAGMRAHVIACFVLPVCEERWLGARGVRLMACTHCLCAKKRRWVVCVHYIVTLYSLYDKKHMWAGTLHIRALLRGQIGHQCITVHYVVSIVN